MSDSFIFHDPYRWCHIQSAQILLWRHMLSSSKVYCFSIIFSKELNDVTKVNCFIFFEYTHHSPVTTYKHHTLPPTPATHHPLPIMHHKPHVKQVTTHQPLCTNTSHLAEHTSQHTLATTNQPPRNSHCAYATHQPLRTNHHTPITMHHTPATTQHPPHTIHHQIRRVDVRSTWLSEQVKWSFIPQRNYTGFNIEIIILFKVSKL